VIFPRDVQIVAGATSRSVGADEQRPPGHSKEHTSCLGFWDQHGVISWEEIERKQDMRAFAQPHAVPEPMARPSDEPNPKRVRWLHDGPRMLR